MVSFWRSFARGRWAACLGGTWAKVAQAGKPIWALAFGSVFVYGLSGELPGIGVFGNGVRRVAGNARERYGIQVLIWG